MQAQALAIPGCHLLSAPHFFDERGDFRKLFHAPTLATLGLETRFAESYLTRSARGVVRGLHFQSPPSEHAKLVCCVAGRVRDALLDLRRGSPTYGHSVVLTLAGSPAQLLYLPRGVAHGFAALEDDSCLWYLVGSAHDPANDHGVRWDSAGIDWWGDAGAPAAPLVSVRDAAFPTLAEFASPFRYEGPA